MVSLDNDGNFDDVDTRHDFFKHSAVQDSIAKEQILAKYVQLTCIAAMQIHSFSLLTKVRS